MGVVSIRGPQSIKVQRVAGLKQITNNIHKENWSIGQVLINPKNEQVYFVNFENAKLVDDADVDVKA